MQLKTIVQAIIGLAALIWAGVLWQGGTFLTWEFLKPYSIVVSIVTLLALVFEAFLWRLPLIRSFVVKRPSIAGTWKTTLVSSYRDEAGLPITKTVYVVISQSMTRLSVRMYTDKAHSYSLAEEMRLSLDGQDCQMTIVYQNIPDIDQRQSDGTGRIHYGGMLIPCLPYHPLSLAGHYWTDRRTDGKLTLEERRSLRVSSFTEGQTLFAKPRSRLDSMLLAIW